MNYKVCVVTVTYGDRRRFLEQVVRRVLSFEEIISVVIVDNASDPPTSAIDDKVILLRNLENTGSAGGYNRGIKYVYNSIDCDLIWLLDDDNLPEEGCLAKLLSKWDAINASNNRKALFCLRDDRSTHVQIAKGEDPYRYYLVNNNFLGFHLGRILYNKYKKITDKFKKAAPYQQYILLPYVPYGGLLLHKDIVAEIGFPNERYFLYVDDSEYSYRITQLGGKIWLIPSCKIVDIDKSIGINYKKTMFHSQLLDQWSFRTYYQVRNRIYFYSRVAKKNNFMFNVNKVLYLAFLQIISVLSSKRSSYNKLLIAVNDGLEGNLGKATPDKF